MSDSSNSSIKDMEKSGNTKQISPAIRWCFTLNNYSQEELEELKSICSNSSKYHIFGFEVGESGTPHLQGYIEFKEKCRPTSKFICKRYHWEKSKGNRESNFAYCSKGGDYIINGMRQKPLKLISNLYPWQQKILDMVDEEPDDRTIIWCHEPEGCKGKSALIKFLCAKRDALMKCGKGNDAKDSVLKWYQNKGYWPSLVLIDLPRSYNSDHLNFPCIEEIKNGCFYSGKFEGGMCLFNSPHVLIMSNDEPDLSQLSKDRWKIIDLREFMKEEPEFI